MPCMCACTGVHNILSPPYLTSYGKGSPRLKIHNSYIKLLTCTTFIFLTTNSANGRTDLLLMVRGLPGVGTNGFSAFSGQYTSHFFYWEKCLQESHIRDLAPSLQHIPGLQRPLSTSLQLEHAAPKSYARNLQSNCQWDLFPEIVC